LRPLGHDGLDAAFDAPVHVLLGLVVVREGDLVQELLAVGWGPQPVGGVEAGDDGGECREGILGEGRPLPLGGIGRKSVQPATELFHGFHEVLA